jgi:mono/diheme cytochrome c family protein/glucose/arabinose dehydrogenase
MKRTLFALPFILATSICVLAQTPATKSARFVRIELPGGDRTLTLAEVEVFSGDKNIARSGKATQSSTDHNAPAERGIDGNKDPEFGRNGQTHTKEGGSNNPWWEVDLGTAAAVDKVTVWNRRGYEDRLEGFTLVLLDAARKEVARVEKAPGGEGIEFDMKKGGKPALLSYSGKPGKPVPKGVVRDATHAPNAEPAAATKVRPQQVAPPTKGERIVLIGNGLAERDVYYGRIETELHLRFPGHQLFVRNMGQVGNTPGFRPHPSRPSQWAFPGAEKFHPDKTTHHGKGIYPTPDQWLTFLKADTIVAFFGYNESFDGKAGVANFEAELDAWVGHTLSKAYNGTAAPRVVLASPIAFEDQSKLRDLPNGKTENENLALYTAAMERVAKKRGVTFVDLFTPTKAAYATAKQPFTTSGFIPTDAGYAQLAPVLADGIFGKTPRASKADPAKVLAAVQQKDWFWNVCDYNIPNGVHTHGQRYNPFGPQNYPDEIKKAREMAELRDAVIYNVAAGKTVSLAVDDSKTHKLPPVETNYKPGGKNGDPAYKYGEEALKTLTVPEGYKVELFASEKEFPNLANPMQLSFDDRGRLWVAVMPTYPHYRPGDALPNDKLLIYEDTNGDGKADKETVFADKLHLPIGFEFAPEGVYVSEEPNLILLRDTNGDDKADVREIVLGGFDSHDTHHAISAYTADPSGAFMMLEGVFLHSNVETAYGPVRCVDGGFFRYSPQRSHLERTAALAIPNPWGFVFDKWGQDFFLHTSGTTMNWAMPSSLKAPYGKKTPLTRDLVPDGHKVRPTSGLEVVSSRHFPDEVQGDIIYCNAIGFLGIKQVKIEDDGTGYKTGHRHDLLKSTDGNFRPADLEFAPDGSLYVLDWHNVLIGHMQHNARDPLRDHVHGRIYRITYPSRPLVTPAKVEGAPIAALLENLKLPEDRARYRTRRELRSRPSNEVLAALKTWVSKLDKKDPNYEHHKLEALWVTWGLNQVDESLLREMLASPDFRARAAAVRVLRYNTHRISDHADLLEKAAADAHGRPRLEVIAAATWLPDTAEAKKIVNLAAAMPLDEWSKNAAKVARERLTGVAETEQPEHPTLPAPAHLTDAEKKEYLAGQKVYFREGACATCHQANGKGLDPAFPPLEKSPWVSGDADRLIKVTLFGLIGPLEINGKKYDGQVPMTPFGGMLNDEEVANVLTFVRNSFGNQASPIKAEQVKAVRTANKGRSSFYTVEELLKEHPMKN